MSSAQVDCSNFTKEFASRQPLASRPDLGDGGNLRPVVDLLVEQVGVHGVYMYV